MSDPAANSRTHHFIGEPLACGDCSTKLTEQKYPREICPKKGSHVLIGFTGKLGAGKDTAIDAIRAIDSRARRMAFADPIVKAMIALDPIITHDWFWRPVRLSNILKRVPMEIAKRQYPEIRRLLQEMGTKVGRKQWGTLFWINLLFNKWDPSIPTLISGVRFPEEIAAIKARGGEIWYIDRPDLKLEAHHNHESENVLDIDTVDGVLQNLDKKQFTATVIDAYKDYLTSRGDSLPTAPSNGTKI